MRRKVWVIFAAIGLVLSMLISPAAAQDDGDGEVVVRIGLHAAEKNLNPFITPQALPITHDFTMLVYDTLFWSQASPNPEPWLATGAEASDDARTWTVTLRDDVTWHDGEAFTAEDVAFTFQYFSDIAGPGRYGHHVYDHPVFASTEVIDDITVALTFAEPVGTFELLPGGDLPILPQHIWDGVEDPRADATSLPVGTGPYKMVDYQPGESYRLEANADYFKGAPTVDTIVMPVVSDAQAAFAALQAGELDFVTRNVPTPLLEPLGGNPDVEVINGSRMQSIYLMFNTRKPMLNDPVVRKAISMGLDLDAFVATIEGGNARPGNDTWTHPDSPWAHPTGGHEYDPAAAATMLDDAGYTLGDDGVRVSADGTPLAFTLLVNAAAPPQVRSGELVAEQLAPLGVAVTVEPLDAPAIGAARRPGPDGPPTVDMFIAVFESHAHADPDHLFFFFHTPGRGVGAVFSGYANAEFDSILEDSLDEAGADKAPLINQAQEIFADEAPAVTLFYPDGRWGYRPAAYNGWISDPGHGVFTKRSFLPDYANTEAMAEEAMEEEAEEPEEADEPAEDEAEAEPVDEEASDDGESEVTEDGGGLGTGGALAIGAAILAVVGGGVVAARRRSGDGSGDGGVTVTD